MRFSAIRLSPSPRCSLFSMRLRQLKFPYLLTHSFACVCSPPCTCDEKMTILVVVYYDSCNNRSLARLFFYASPLVLFVLAVLSELLHARATSNTDLCICLSVSLSLFLM